MMGIWYLDPNGIDASGRGTSPQTPARTIRWLERKGFLQPPPIGQPGNVIWLADGVYTEVLDPKDLKSRLTIAATNPRKAIFRPVGGDFVFEFVGKTDVTLSGLVIDGELTRFDAVKIKQNSRGFVIEECEIRNSTQSGLMTSDSADDVWIENCHFSNIGIGDEDDEYEAPAGDDPFHHGIYAQGNKLTVLHCTFEYCGGGAIVNKGVPFTGNIEGVVLNHNTILNCGRGIVLDDVRAAEVVANMIDGVKSAAIGVDVRGKALIKYNILRNGGASDEDGGNAIRIGKQATNAEVRFNSFFNFKRGITAALPDNPRTLIIQDNNYDLITEPDLIRER